MHGSVGDAAGVGRTLLGVAALPMQHSLCIFTSCDACRPDALTLQLIALRGDIFAEEALDVCIVPSQVLSTSSHTRILDAVPNAPSRNMGSPLVGSSKAACSTPSSSSSAAPTRFCSAVCSAPSSGVQQRPR